MEQQVLDLLVGTLDPSDPIRNDAEHRLETLYTDDAFPVSLVAIASHASVPTIHRQAALLYLKKLILRTWSSSLDEYEGPVTMKEEVKVQIRENVLNIAIGKGEERKIVAAAALVVSKIASADFPEQWPTLLPTLLSLVPKAEATQLYGVLIVLSNLVEDGFDEEQFSASAVELVKCLYDVAVNGQQKMMSRALAVSIFRACFDTMELVYATNPDSVQQFMQQASDAWTPFFLDAVKMPLPQIPSAEERNGVRSEWQGVIALKTQVVKALDKISTMFPQLVSTRNLELFVTVWEALQAHLAPYHTLYTGDETAQGRLEDSDRLPISLDFLVIEELDYMHTLLGLAAVKQELDNQLHSGEGGLNTTWITQILAVAVGYSYIPTEDAEMWDLDVNCFLSEETSETANYTARNACAGLTATLSNLRWPVPEILLAYSKPIFEDTSSSAKCKEALLFVLKQVIEEIESYDRGLAPDVASAYLDFVRIAVHDRENDYLRARGFIVAGAIVASPYEGKGVEALIPDFAHQSLKAVENDESDMVKVSCLRVMQRYLKHLPADKAQDLQVQTVKGLSSFIAGQDMNELADGEDLLETLVETLRDAILADPAYSLEHSAIDLLFTMATYGASSWNTTMIIGEAFEAVTSTMSSKGPEAYSRLCTKVIHSLTSALDVGDMTQENALSDIAVSLIATLAEYGSEPLPAGFVSTILPKLHRLLFMSQEFSVHQSATLAIKHILAHDPAQLFAWRDPETGKEGLEIMLLIIDRLLGPNVEESSGDEVGGLAVELVEKAGAERLGPYLMQLLQVVAVRLSTAERANFIQNLVLVFARLSATHAKEVLDFLAQVQIEGVGGGSGLEVVIRKWLDNSVNFSGYDAIRQNIVALSEIYKLHDERLEQIQTKGDLLVENTSRIKTRSQAKKTPDQYSIIPVSLKLTKVLLQELSPSPNKPVFSPSLSNGRKHSIVSEGDDEEWEDDEPAVLDLTASSTRQELMGYMDETLWNHRGTDDETQKFLVQFFNEISHDPAFQKMYPMLSDAERRKLNEMNTASG